MDWPTARNQDEIVMIEILCCYVARTKERRADILQKTVLRGQYREQAGIPEKARIVFSLQFEDVQTVLGGQGPYHGARRMVPALVVIALVGGYRLFEDCFDM